MEKQAKKEECTNLIEMRRTKNVGRLAALHDSETTNTDSESADEVVLKWSEVLESAFDYYYSEYVPAWTLNETPFNKVGDIIFIHKKSGRWVGWVTIDLQSRPDVATLFDLVPDLPGDEEHRHIVCELRRDGINDPEDYFWENMFSYKHTNEVETTGGRKYKITWEP